MNCNSQNTEVNEQKVPWGIWDTIYISLFVIFVSILISCIVNYFNLSKENVLLAAFIQIFIPCLAIGCIYIATKYIYKVSFIDTLGLRISKDNFKNYLFTGIYISILIVVWSMFVSFLVVHFTEKPMDNPYQDYSSEQLKMISILAICIAPFFEEIFFRGFIQPAVCQAIGNIPGVILVAVIFTLIHHQYKSHIGAILIIIGLSLILGFARLYTKSTVPSIIGHLLNNVYATIFVILGNYA